ncbi:hypothetical protein DRO34_02950 [Candidatus Bathyarchaeota archaeon]|nr:MAG: hypothetical protein DRO34_02950 [Candidatus Bathyarchaeota archaeon]
MLDTWYAWKLAYDICGLAVVVGLIYITLRLLIVFKEGIMGKAWSYVSCGVLTLSLGIALFIFHSLLSLSDVIYKIGNTLVLVGGILTLTGFYAQYKFWNQKS